VLFTIRFMDKYKETLYIHPKNLKKLSLFFYIYTFCVYTIYLGVASVSIIN
jgi:hypothetical protein